MAVSISDLITRVRSSLNERPFVSTATLTSAGDLIATVTDGGDWEEGAIMEFQDNGEQCLVQSVSGNDVTVVRSWNGTTAQTHTSITVFRDPEFTYKSISDALTSSVNDLWPHAYKVVSDSIVPNPGVTVWYPLANDALGLIRVLQEYGTSGEKLGIFGGGRGERQVVFETGLPASFTTNSVALRFPDGFYGTANLVVDYAAAITGTSDIEDDGELNVATAVVYGALARLLADKEVGRVSLAEDSEAARSIRVGGRLSAASYYERACQREKEMLRIKHRQQHPIMPIRKVK